MRSHEISSLRKLVAARHAPERIREHLALLQNALRNLKRYLKRSDAVPEPADDEELWLHLDGAEFMIIVREKEQRR